jgi:hypothetical protein
MKKMKKVLALLTAGALLFGCMFTSCSNGSGGGGNGGDENDPDLKYKINIVESENGSFSVDQTTEIEKDDYVFIKVFPDKDYKVASVNVYESNRTTSVTVKNNVFKMPSDDVYIKVTFEAITEPQKYSITLTGCTATTILAAEGETVTLTADILEGGIFDGWKSLSGDVTFKDQMAETTTFKMPAKNVSVMAAFVILKPHKVTVENGTADPSKARPGEKVTIKANPTTEDQMFHKWESNELQEDEFDSINSETTTFIMPDTDVLVKATYKEFDPSTLIGTKRYGILPLDIVFIDGSATPYSDDLELTDEQKKLVAGIIVGQDVDTKTGRVVVYGIGLAQDSGLKWCDKNASAYKVKVETIATSLPKDYKATQPPSSMSSFKMDGDTDGTDNLEQISAYLKQKGLTDDTENPEMYPLFYFAKNYKEQSKANVKGTKYEEGWYIPTAREMFFVYLYKDGLNKALKKCGGDAIKRYYQTSNQSAGDYVYQSLYTFLDTAESAYTKFAVIDTNKDSPENYSATYRVLAMRRF